MIQSEVPFCLSCQSWLKVLFENLRLFRCFAQSLIRCLTTQFLDFWFPAFIIFLLKDACFQIFHAILSPRALFPSSTALCRFSNKSSCRFILTAHTSVQFPHKEE